MNFIPYRIGFVCSGNICRSPYAEGLLRHRMADFPWAERVEVSSAGTLGIDDAPASSSTMTIAIERGVNLLSHRSQGVSEEWIARQDLVIGLDRNHIGELRDRFPDHHARIYLLGSFPEHELVGADVPDPVGCEEEFFREVHEQIEVALAPLLHFFRQRYEPSESDED
ncbi:MAG: low molecular weight protein-tyrosine-phosphatase [Planctomycetota bacterium]